MFSYTGTQQTAALALIPDSVYQSNVSTQFQGKKRKKTLPYIRQATACHGDAMGTVHPSSLGTQTTGQINHPGGSQAPWLMATEQTTYAKVDLVTDLKTSCKANNIVKEAYLGKAEGMIKEKAWALQLGDTTGERGWGTEGQKEELHASSNILSFLSFYERVYICIRQW